MPDGADPIALAYAGHQFGHFVPALGDGRAVLLGEVIARDGRRLDLQLKGSGRTVFSRRGDGKAAVAILANPDEAAAVSAKLTELGGVLEVHEVSDAAVEEAVAEAEEAPAEDGAEAAEPEESDEEAQP